MTEDEIFKVVQKYLENVPLILVGTGGTIPYGIPGMSQLSQYLLNELDCKYKADDEWSKFTGRIKSGVDLESALTELQLTDEIINDIKKSTWQLVTDADLDLLNNIIEKSTKLPIARLIQRFYNFHPKCVNIVTTNYDRVIEYACDQINVRLDTKFHGNYIKYFSANKLSMTNIVNLLKVHGSLDLFKDQDDLVYAIPIQQKIPNGFIPEIVTPGSFKYRSVLQGTCRQILHDGDDLINNAKSYLCIGYGFNDEQIQANIIAGIRMGKPIVVVTKQISNKAYELLANNSKQFVIIQENNCKANSTEFIVNNQKSYLDDTYWTVDGLLKIIE